MESLSLGYKVWRRNYFYFKVLKLLAKNSFCDNVLAEYYLKKLMMWFNVWN